MEQLFIRLLTPTHVCATHAGWALYRNGQSIATSEQDMPLMQFAKALPPAQGTRQIIAIVPGQHVLLSRVNVPRGQRRHLHTILPFLLEERLAEPVAAMHIAAFPPFDDEGNLPVAAVKSSLMREWLQLLGEAGIIPHALVAEPCLLQPGNVASDARFSVVHATPHDGYTVANTMLADLLGLLKPGLPGGAVLQCTACGPEAESFLQTLGMPATERPTASSLSDLLFRAAVAQGAGLMHYNLLQGEFRPQAGRAQSETGRRLLARAVAIACVGMLTIHMGESAYLAYKAQQFRTATVALYRELFPGDSKIIDPRAQMESYLSGRSASGDGFLPLVQKLASAWPADAASSLQMQNLSYREADRNLSITLTSATMDSLTTLTQKLSNGGFSARIQSVVNSAQGVNAQLLIRKEAP